VGAFSLLAEEAEELDRLGVGGAEPVRDAGVELGRLTGREHQVVLAEDDPQSPVEDIEPLVALVRLRLGFPAAAGGRDNQLVGLDAAGPAGQRQHGHAVAGDRAQVDPRVTGGRGAHEFVERDAVGSGQRQQQFQVRPAGTGLQPGQGAHRDAGRRRQVGQRGVPLTAQRTEAGADRGERLVKVVVVHAR
jgi:hypothetical protein